MDMYTPKLVSIVIPLFNREDLIAETLNSILKQSYSNWECIVVDDGSTDASCEVVNEYIKDDARFFLFKRPDSLQKGANSCRNYGKEHSKGEYLIFFDSDDIMLVDKLKHHVISLESDNKIGFSVSRFSNFSHEGSYVSSGYDPYSNNQKSQLSLDNYLMQSVFWGTIDVMYRSILIKDVWFKSGLKSGQEYYFNVSFLCVNEGVLGEFINEESSLRRIHDGSIQEKQKIDRKSYLCNKFDVYYNTLYDNWGFFSHKQGEYLLLKIVSLYNSMCLAGYRYEKVDVYPLVKELKGSMIARVCGLVLSCSRVFRSGYSISSSVIKFVLRGQN